MTTTTKKPTIAVIGRPNVGKSTLINRILGFRKAIVHDEPGVTRDRAYYDVEWQKTPFTLIDTGGLVPNSDELFEALINEQVKLALAESDLILFLVDGQAGVTPVDEAIAQQIRQLKKTALLAVNKIDEPHQQHNTAEFYQLGLGEPMALSAMHGNVGVGDLLDKAMAIVDEQTKNTNGKAKTVANKPTEPTDTLAETDVDALVDAQAEKPTGPIHIAIVGRPNVGKSSLLNCLIGEDRTIVSNIPGTTRDAIDVQMTHNGQDYVLVDTAGIRKRGKVDYGVEMFSVDRSLKALQDANVTVLVLDATENENTEKKFVTDQDKKIVTTSNEAGRGLVIVVNKWDKIANKTTTTTEDYKKIVFEALPHARFAPVVFTSAVKKQRIQSILAQVDFVHANWQRRIQTSLVNQVIMEAVALSPPPNVKNKSLNVLYATQSGTAPPHFVLFVNNAKLLTTSYRRYLEKKLRERFEFAGSPIVLSAKSRGEN